MPCNTQPEVTVAEFLAALDDVLADDDTVARYTHIDDDTGEIIIEAGEGWLEGLDLSLFE